MGILFIDAGAGTCPCAGTAPSAASPPCWRAAGAVRGSDRSEHRYPSRTVRNVATRATVENGSVTSVAFRNVPSFILLGDGRGSQVWGCPFDVAYGGNTYAIADAAFSRP